MIDIFLLMRAMKKMETSCNQVLDKVKLSTFYSINIARLSMEILH